MAGLSTEVEQRVKAKIAEQLEDTVASLCEYVSIPSVSVGDGSGMREAADFLAQRYRDFGCIEVEVVETSTYPGVYAFYDAGAPRTILSYAMYDVRSVGESAGWLSDPVPRRRSRALDITM